MNDVNKELLEALKAITSHVEDMGNLCSVSCANDTAFNSLYEKAISAIARAEAELANEAGADDDGWIKWYGGSLPKLFVRLRSGDVMSGAIDEFSWERDGDLGDILSFKLEPTS